MSLETVPSKVSYPSSTTTPSSSKITAHTLAATSTTTTKTTTNTKKKKKIIYFVRHAEAEHNIKEREAVEAAIANGVTCKEEQEKARRAVLNDEKLRDAPLTDDGKIQVRQKIHDLTLLNTLSRCDSSNESLTGLAAAAEHNATNATTTTTTASASGSVCSDDDDDCDDDDDSSCDGSDRDGYDSDDDESVVSVDSKCSGSCDKDVINNSNRSSVSSNSDTKKFPAPQIVLVSPLRRALMTATELFYKPPTEHNQNKETTKFVALEILREKRTGFIADECSPVDILEQEFPHVDFTNIRQSQYNQEGGLTVLSGEDNAKVRQRCKTFLESSYLNQELDEDAIAIVTHKGWLRELRHTIKSYADNQQMNVDFDLESWHQTLYKNAEIRVAEFHWDGRNPQLASSIISRSVENAMGSVVENAVQHLIQQATIKHMEKMMMKTMMETMMMTKQQQQKEQKQPQQRPQQKQAQQKQAQQQIRKQPEQELRPLLQQQVCQQQLHQAEDDDGGLSSGSTSSRSTIDVTTKVSTKTTQLINANKTSIPGTASITKKQRIRSKTTKTTAWKVIPESQ